MQIVTRTQKNLDCLEDTIEYDKQQRHRAIAEAWLAKLSQADQSQNPDELDDAIQLAQKRRQQFESLLPAMTALENFLSNPDLKGLYLPLEQQWYQAIDQIGDLTVDENVIDKFATRLQTLAHTQSLLEDSYRFVSSFQNSPNVDPYPSFKAFRDAFRALWPYFFDFQDPNADKAVITIMYQFPQPNHQKQSA